MKTTHMMFCHITRRLAGSKFAHDCSWSTLGRTRLWLAPDLTGWKFACECFQSAPSWFKNCWQVFVVTPWLVHYLLANVPAVSKLARHCFRLAYPGTNLAGKCVWSTLDWLNCFAFGPWWRGHRALHNVLHSFCPVPALASLWHNLVGNLHDAAT
jgi:hypothetical protein